METVMKRAFVITLIAAGLVAVSGCGADDGGQDQLPGGPNVAAGPAISLKVDGMS